MAKHIHIKGTKGADTIIGTEADEHAKAKKGNDSIDAGGGNDNVNAGSGNDIVIYRLADNTTGMDRDKFRGGSGIDTLRVELTKAEWLGSLDLQHDMNDYRGFLNKVHHNGKGEADGKEFRFDMFDLRAAQFEKLEVVVGGTTIASKAKIVGTATGSVIEDATANTATGTLVVLDLDAGESTFGTTSGAYGGTYGDFTFNAVTGGWNYTLDNSRPATNGLAQAEHAEDKLTVTSADGHTTRDIVVSITGANAAPVAVNDSYVMAPNTQLTVPAPGFLGNDVDSDGDALTIAQFTAPGHRLSFNMNLSANVGFFDYRPLATFHGTESFTYKLSDGSLESNVATVTITVDQAPVATIGPKAASGTIGQPFSLPLQATAFTDPDGDTLTYSAVMGRYQDPKGFHHDGLPAWLTLDPATGSLSGTPDNTAGVVSFKIQATDPFGLSATIDVGIMLF